MFGGSSTTRWAARRFFASLSVFDSVDAAGQIRASGAVAGEDSPRSVDCAHINLADVFAGGRVLVIRVFTGCDGPD